jgi:hypothetical protein
MPTQLRSAYGERGAAQRHPNRRAAIAAIVFILLVMARRQNKSSNVVSWSVDCSEQVTSHLEAVIPSDANSAKSNRRSLDYARDDNRFRGCS